MLKTAHSPTRQRGSRRRDTENLTYGNIISVYTGLDEAITTLTDDGVEEMQDMLRDARLTTQTWHDFLDDFVDDPELAARFKDKKLR